MSSISTEIETYSQAKHLVMLRDLSRQLSHVSTLELVAHPLSSFMNQCQLLHHCLLESDQGEAMVLLQGGRLVAIGGYGITVDSAGNSIGCPWFLYSRRLMFNRGVLKKFRGLLELWALRNPGLTFANRALAEHKPTLRWLKFLGFTIGPVITPWAYFYRKGG